MIIFNGRLEVYYINSENSRHLHLRIREKDINTLLTKV